MDATEQVAKFAEFFETQFYEQLLSASSKGEKFLVVPFSDLSKFNIELAEDLLEDPDNVLQAATHTIEQMDLGDDVKGFEIRFSHLPETSFLKIRNIRSKHIGKFILLEGIIRQKSDVRPQVTNARFECPSCGNIIPVLQVDQKFREPSMCAACGRKGQFRILHKELVDAQKITLEEAPEDMDGGEQPKRLGIFLKNDLVSPITEKKTNPGSKIRVSGVVKEVPITLATGGKSTRFDLMCEANYVEPIQEEFTNIVFTPEEIEQIKEKGKDPRVFEHLAESLAPTIYGHDKIKEALLLQLFAGVQKKSEDGVTRRGDIHILLIGDPGSGKCVSGDTEVTLASGAITTMKQLVGDVDGQQEISSLSLPALQLSGAMGVQHATRVWRRKEKELLNVTLRSGKELKITKDHPLFTTIHASIFAQPASDFSIGHYIATPRMLSVNGSVQSCSFEAQRYNNMGKEYSFPQHITPSLARLAGYLCGDGYLSPSKTSAWLGFTNTSEELLSDYTALFTSLFHQHPTRRDAHRGKSASELYVLSKNLYSFFSTHFPEITQKSSQKTIPQSILKSEDVVLAEFIKSLFDCDAHVNANKRHIEYCTISHDLAKKVQQSLLRFGVVSFLKKKRKYATNTVKKRVVDAYEIIISGSFATEYARKIGFTSQDKQRKLLSFIDLQQNTNIDLVPGVGDMLTIVRKELGLFQKDMGISRSTYQHYERGDRLPSTQTLRKIADFVTTIAPDNLLASILYQLAYADIFWDEIISIEPVENIEEYVYDLEVSNTHNFVANGVLIHNSQLIRRMSIVAPKSRFISGKGSSGAGLCVSPQSIVCTNPGGMESIERVVEDNFTKPEEYRPGIWKESNISSVKIQSMNNDLKLHSQHPDAIWKLEAPQQVVEVTLNSGKRIELTANTSLFTINNATPAWKKSIDFKEGEYVATPRMLIGGDVSQQYVVDLLTSNPVVHHVKPFVKNIVEQLGKKYGSLRLAAKNVSVNENQLYHHWVNTSAAGNIKLHSLKKLADNVGVDWKHEVKQVSLYNGKNHRIPTVLSKNFLYVAGLLAGDGDIASSTNSFAVRLSSSEKALHTAFRDVLTEEFSLSYDVQPGSSKRPEATRTSSKLLAEILFSLGIPPSPKSHSLSCSQKLLHLSNDLISEYIAGLFDADGSVSVRTGKGSDTIKYYTSSELFARQLQLVLLRFGIHARLRKRAPSTGKIISHYPRWVLTISGSHQHKLFAQHFSLRHPKKKANLEQLAQKQSVSHTNLDIVPGVGLRVKEALMKQHISVDGWHKNWSREGLKNFLSKKKIIDIELLTLANSDIFWDRVKEVKLKDANYEYVYDLTVKDSHNFVVDGILVHNTASVIKDDFLKGWALEAGALVLANKGLAAIDELDKMSAEDTSAMHEALEQQCYDYDTIISLADGSEVKIGDFVEQYFKNHPDKSIQGHNCFILENGVVTESVLSTDWSTISPTHIARVSKHIAPSHMQKITFTNGRSITVTPEHPVFVLHKGRPVVVRADKVEVHSQVPVPLHAPIDGEKQFFATQAHEIFNARAQNHIKVPAHNGVSLFRLVGHLLAEGSKEVNRGKLIGINFTNKNTLLLEDVKTSMRALFNLDPYEQLRVDDHEPRMMLRYISTELASFFQKELPELLELSTYKSVPAQLMKGKKSDIAHMLQTMFEGDGCVAVKPRTLRISYASNSRRLVEQVQDLLLRFGIRSSITEHKKTYKVNITGYRNIELFNQHIACMTPQRTHKIEEYLSTRTTPRTIKESIKGIGTLVIELMDEYDIKIIGKNKRSTMKCDYLTKGKGISRSHLQKLVLVLETKKLSEKDKSTVAMLRTLAFGEIGVERIIKNQRVPSSHPWTYDITIEPHHTFISQAAVLHNTVTISKANIQATLNCQTTVLAAANPKFGRFDPYELIAKQIELPSTLINRFDLIFPVRDLPDKARDDQMASFILNLHRGNKAEKQEGLLDTQFIRKYIAYAKQNVQPEITDAALEEIKRYYVQMRNQGHGEGAISAIPISARQLEGLVRLSEASAKTRLSPKVTKKDAQRAIELTHYCLSQIGMDPETGKIDIDRITTGITASQRSHISLIKEVITGLETAIGKIIPVDDVVREAEIKGISEEKTTEVLEKLKRSGDLFSPKQGFISKI